MAHRAAGRRSSHGIDGAILETSVGSARTVLEADLRETRGRKAEVRNVASGAGTVQSWTAGTQERFPRCRTPSEARPGAAAKPIGVSSGRGPYQVVQPGLRPVRR